MLCLDKQIGGLLKRDVQLALLPKPVLLLKSDKQLILDL